MILPQTQTQSRLAHVEVKVGAAAVVGVVVAVGAAEVVAVVMGDVAEGGQAVAVQVAVEQCNLN